jgi:hypothetical protein
MDNLMLNTQSMTYLKLPKRGEWCDDLWKIWSFVQIFNEIKIINEDNPNYAIIRVSPDWSDFETSMLDHSCMDAMVEMVSDLTFGVSRAVCLLNGMCEEHRRKLDAALERSEVE